MTPPRRVWIVVAVCLLLIGVVRASQIIGDFAATNVVTLILAFIALMTVGMWFVFHSGYAGRWRAVPVVGALAVIGFSAARYEIVGVNGVLIPKFRVRGLRAPDESLTTPVVGASAGVDLSTTTADDFPQFLGPLRNAVVPQAVAPDWTSRPPKLLWRQPIGAGWSGFAVVNGFAVTIEQRGQQELVTCYEVATGKLRWSHAEPGRHATVLGGVGPRSTPTIHGGKVFTLGAFGVVLCLDGRNGQVLWRDDLLRRCGVTPDEDLHAIAWGRAASPLIVDDLVVLPLGGSAGGPFTSLIAWDQQTGAVAWTGGNEQASYSSPVLTTLLGRRQIVSVNESSVTGHEPATGKVLWRYPWFGSSNGNASTSQPQPIDDQRLLITKGYGGGATMLELSAAGRDALQAQVRWKQSTLLKTKFTNVAIRDGHAYGLSDGILECVDLATGRRVWKPGRARFGHGQVLLAGDVLLVQAETGRVHLVAATPDEFAELGVLEALDGQTWNTLCLAGEHLLVRNSEQAACFQVVVRQR